MATVGVVSSLTKRLKNPEGREKSCRSSGTPKYSGDSSESLDSVLEAEHVAITLDHGCNSVYSKPQWR